MSSFQFLPWHYRDNKHLKIISLWHPPMHNLDENSVDVICTSWKLRGNFFFEKRAFYCLNQLLMPKRTTKFAKWASCKIQYLELFNWIMEWRNSGSAMSADYLETWDGRISLRIIISYHLTRNKSLTKWYSNIICYH